MTDRAQHRLGVPGFLPLNNQQAAAQQEILGNLVRANPELVKVSIIWEDVSLNSDFTRETVLSTPCAH